MIGRRVQFFRKRSGISQFDLEIKANLSTGTLSRIENEVVNPTKETIMLIANILNLSNRELDYLIGKTAIPLTKDEVYSAIDEVRPFFEKKGFFAYLLDEKWRIHYFSKSFTSLFKAPIEDVNAALGKSTMELATNPNLPVYRLFDDKHYTQMLEFNLPYYYSQTHFMQDDESFIKTVASIDRNPTAKEIWNKLTPVSSTNYLGPESRIVYFKTGNVSVPLKFSREALLKNSRFEVVEFIPINPILREIAKRL